MKTRTCCNLYFDKIEMQYSWEDSLPLSKFEEIYALIYIKMMYQKQNFV